MIIKYATAHRWIKDVTEDPMKAFGKNQTARMRSTLNKIDNFNIETKFEELNGEFLDWFMPVYKKRINEKANPVVFDIRGKTIDKEGQKKIYYSLTLYEDGVKIGATIYSAPKNRMSVAYRTYENTWKNAKLQANPSLYTEYVICKHAYELGKEILIHGKDRNPYGVNSSIGLAGFKLSAGCQPVKSYKYEIEEIDTKSLDKDALILEYPGDDIRKITKAHLVTTRENEQKYMQVTKYPDRLNVSVHYRN